MTFYGDTPAWKKKNLIKNFHRKCACLLKSHSRRIRHIPHAAHFHRMERRLWPVWVREVERGTDKSNGRQAQLSFCSKNELICKWEKNMPSIHFLTTYKQSVDSSALKLAKPKQKCFWKAVLFVFVLLPKNRHQCCRPRKAAPKHPFGHVCKNLSRDFS